jgi:hypothetical protein
MASWKRRQDEAARRLLPWGCGLRRLDYPGALLIPFNFCDSPSGDTLPAIPWVGRYMTASWASFEDKVRAVASAIWNGDCKPQNIGGVAIDGVMILSRDAQIFIEMTERRELDKVREDVNKLQLARNAYLTQHQSFPRCYCVAKKRARRRVLEIAAPSTSAAL